MRSPYKKAVFRSPGPIAFQAGPFTLRWYGLLMATAMAVGLWLAHRDAGRRGLDAEDLLKAAELALLGGLVGARLYYVAFNLDYYSMAPAKIFAVWEGGLAIHGGVLGGILVGGGYAWLRRLPVRTYLDIAAPSLALGQAIGRWGNFFNEEAFGTPTNLPWKLFISQSQRPLEYAQGRVLPPDLPVRIALGRGGVRAARLRVSQAPRARAGRPLPDLLRPVLDGPLHDRIAPHGCPHARSRFASRSSRACSAWPPHCSASRG